MKDVKNVIAIDTKVKTSEVVVAAVDTSKDPENVLKNYLFDNTTGLLTELTTSYIDPMFYKDNYILGIISDSCSGLCNSESDYYFSENGLSIYDIKSKKETTIIQ
jgi:hypothetical protein